MSKQISKTAELSATEKRAPVAPTDRLTSEESAEEKTKGRTTGSQFSAWPPPPTPRVRRPRWKTVAMSGSIVLGLCLLVAASTLIIYGTTRGYSHALTRAATLETQQTRNAVGTVQARIQGTQQALAKEQQAIEATATAQANTTTVAVAATAAATATDTANQDQLSLWTQGSPQFTDALSNDQGSGGWDQGGASSYVGCTFQNGSYHASENQSTYLQPCIAQKTSFTNFAYQIEMTSEKGNHAQAGLLFRVASSNDAYYFFYISTDGDYGIEYYSNSGTATALVQGNSDAINTGVGATNELTIIVNKDQLQLFANGQYLDKASNSALSSGKIGVGVVDNETPVRVAFSNAQVWQYKQGSQK
jgi:Domain of Unknown Function (DUF1080).